MSARHQGRQAVNEFHGQNLGNGEVETRAHPLQLHLDCSKPPATDKTFLRLLLQQSGGFPVRHFIIGPVLTHCFSRQRACGRHIGNTSAPLAEALCPLSCMRLAFELEKVCHFWFLLQHTLGRLMSCHPAPPAQPAIPAQRDV